MIFSKRIVGCLMLTIYSMVLLHELVPHIHLDLDVDHVALLGDTDHHHSHEQSHDHDHEDSEEIGFIHSLGHLLGDGFHTHEAQDHLAHVATDYKVSLSKLKFYYAVLISFVLPANETLEKEPIPPFSPPPYEQCLYSATPLRAPPSLV